MVNLKRQNNRVRLEINIDAAHKVGIKFNAKLLDIATIVNALSP